MNKSFIVVDDLRTVWLKKPVITAIPVSIFTVIFRALSACPTSVYLTPYLTFLLALYFTNHYVILEVLEIPFWHLGFQASPGNSREVC